MFKRIELYVCYLGNPYNSGRYPSELMWLPSPNWEWVPTKFDLEPLLKPVM